jgi:hypothetical protein
MSPEQQVAQLLKQAITLLNGTPANGTPANGSKADYTQVQAEGLASPADVWQQLCDLILQELPYRYDADGQPELLQQLSANSGPTIALDRGGPASSFNATNQLPATGPDGTQSEEWIRNRPWESMWWSFNGTPFRVTKALKIPYKVTQGGVTDTKHILIGYMGVDPSGG